MFLELSNYWALISGALGVVILFLMLYSAYLMKKLREQSVFLQSYSEGLLNIGKRCSRLEKYLGKGWQQDMEEERLPHSSQEVQDSLYKKAVEVASLGLSADDIKSSFGLSQTEADLIVAMSENLGEALQHTSGESTEFNDVEEERKPPVLNRRAMSAYNEIGD